MKKVMILGFVAASAVSSLSHAVTNGAACAAPAAAQTSTVTVTGGGTYFVKVDFTPKCSANVHMAFSQNGTAFGVMSGSSKGKFSFGGGTGGGGVKTQSQCPATGCTTTEVTTALALTRAGES